MRTALLALLVAGAFALTTVGDALAASATPPSLTFAGREWFVKTGFAGPGPNKWAQKNAWVDATGALHLKISYIRGAWRCAEVWTKDPVGFGHYGFTVDGPVGALDKNVVLGLFTYGGVDFVNEIDVELGRFGDAARLPGMFSVYPAVPGTDSATSSYAIPPTVTRSTHTIDWSSTKVAFSSVDGAGTSLGAWTFAPARPAALIPQTPEHLYLTLMLSHGAPPSNGKSAEIVIRDLQAP